MSNLSSQWIEELNNVRNENILSPSTYERVVDLAVLLNASDILITHYNKKKRKVDKVQNLQMISYYYFVHCYHLGYALYHLARKGFGSACIVLLRPMIESIINLSYLWLCKKINGKDTDELYAWTNYSSVNRNSIDKRWKQLQAHRAELGYPSLTPEKLLEETTSKEYEKDAVEFRLKYGRKHWSKISSLDGRARAVDDTGILFKRTGIVLEDLYVMCYKWLSELVHGDSSGAESYIHEVSEKLYIDFGPNHKNVDIILPMCTQVMIQLLDITNHINHLNVDLLRQYKESGLSVLHRKNVD
ncbi:MAG: DUF5677 domain-containing protein [Peptococcaceae bacterium]